MTAIYLGVAKRTLDEEYELVVAASRESVIKDEGTAIEILTRTTTNLHKKA